MNDHDDREEMTIDDHDQLIPDQRVLVPTVVNFLHSPNQHRSKTALVGRESPDLQLLQVPQPPAAAGGVSVPDRSGEIFLNFEGEQLREPSAAAGCCCTRL